MLHFNDLDKETREIILNDLEKCRSFKKQYYKKHKLCPKCQTDKYCSTLMAFTCDSNNLESYQDLNDVTCACGWTGTVHDLIGELKINVR